MKYFIKTTGYIKRAKKAHLWVDGRTPCPLSTRLAPELLKDYQVVDDTDVEVCKECMKKMKKEPVPLVIDRKPHWIITSKWSGGD